MLACKDRQDNFWEFYLDGIGEWRWKCFNKSHRLDGAAAFGYKSKEDCIDNARLNGMKCIPKKVRKQHTNNNLADSKDSWEVTIPIGFRLQFKITLMRVGA